MFKALVLAALAAAHLGAENAPIDAIQVCSAEGSYGVTSADRESGLSGIARRFYGSGREWFRLMQANQQKYPTLADNPNLIQIGWVLSIPCLSNLPSVDKKQLAAFISRTQAKVTVMSVVLGHAFEAPKLPSTVALIKEPRVGEIEVAGVQTLASLTSIPLAPTWSRQEIAQASSAVPPVLQEEVRPVEQEADRVVLPSVASALVSSKSVVSKVQKPKGKKGTIMKKVVTAPFRAAVWPFKNRVPALLYTLSALNFSMIPQLQVIGRVGTPIAMTAFAARPAMAEKKVAAGKHEQFAVPTREEVERAGAAPYLRYTVPPGELVHGDNALFNQPRYSGQKTLKGLRTALASDINLRRVRMEIPDKAWVEVDVDPNAIVYVDPETNEPLYIKGCTFRGKEFANRIMRVPSQTPVIVTQTTPAPQQPQPPIQQIVRSEDGRANANASASIVGAAFPNPLNISLALANQQASTTSTQKVFVVMETKQTRAQAFKLYASGTRDVLLGTAAQTAAILFPQAWKYAARNSKANSNVFNVTGGNATSTSDAKAAADAAAAAEAAAQADAAAQSGKP